jgi:hypothetical protein
MTRTGRVLLAAEAEDTKACELGNGEPLHCSPSGVGGALCEKVRRGKKGVSPGEASGTTRDALNPLSEGENTDVGPLAYRWWTKSTKREFLL